MKIIWLGLIFIISIQAQSQTILTYKYLKAPSSKQRSVTFKEVQQVYGLVKKQAFLYPPDPQAFFKDYLRFRLGVEVALHNKSLVKDSNIDTLITNPYLKAGFHQEIYKAFAETSLQKEMKKLEKQTRTLSKGKLKQLYSKDPQFQLSLISIQHPVNPTKKQIKEALSRARTVHSQVKRSKKPFPQLVALYSDSKQASLVNQIGTKATILPEIYKSIKKMANGSISKPLKTPLGFAIVKLVQRIPYSKTIHERPLKENYFSERRTKIFNSFMDKLKKHFKITYVNKKLIRTLK